MKYRYDMILQRYVYNVGRRRYLGSVSLGVELDTDGAASMLRLFGEEAKRIEGVDRVGYLMSHVSSLVSQISGLIPRARLTRPTSHVPPSKTLPTRRGDHTVTSGMVS